MDLWVGSFVLSPHWCDIERDIKDMPCTRLWGLSFRNISRVSMLFIRRSLRPTKLVAKATLFVVLRSRPFIRLCASIPRRAGKASMLIPVSTSLNSDLISKTDSTFFFDVAFTSRIVGVPKVESDTILKLLYRQMAENPDFQVRFKWEKNSLAMWDNRVSNNIRLAMFAT